MPVMALSPTFVDDAKSAPRPIFDDMYARAYLTLRDAWTLPDWAPPFGVRAYCDYGAHRLRSPTRGINRDR